MKFSNKEFEYFDYIVEHRKNLMTAYNMFAEMYRRHSTDLKMGLMNKAEFVELKDRVLNHDLSKFGKDEFNKYRLYFFNEDGVNKKPFEKGFKEAFKSHYMNNPHHPQYHLEHGTKMSRLDTVEMVLDWTAMSIKFNDTPSAFYAMKKDSLIKEFGDIINHEIVEVLVENIK